MPENTIENPSTTPEGTQPAEAGIDPLTEIKIELDNLKKINGEYEKKFNEMNKSLSGVLESNVKLVNMLNAKTPEVKEQTEDSYDKLIKDLKL